MASTDAALLGTFQKHIEDMRALVQCKICLKPFYEPFTLSCGHTYCYSCLSSWLGGSHNRAKSRNCPDCRSIIRTEPCPNYTLRDLVHMFLNRAELLPEDETIQEHEAGKADEAAVLASDKSGRGLFKGIFTRPRLAIGNRPPHLPIAEHPIWDEDDHVERCPNCTFELEDGMCNHCGWEDHDISGDSVGDITEGTYDSDGNTRSVSPVQGAHAVAHLPFGFHMDYYDQESQVSDDHYPVHGYPARSVSVSDDDDDEADEDNSEMDDFIDDDEDLDHPDEADADGYEGRSAASPVYYDFNGGSPRPYESDAETETTTRRSPGTYDVHYHYEVSSEPQTDDNAFEDDHPGFSTSSRRPTYNINYDSETGEDGEDSGTENQTIYDSDGSSVQEIAPPPQSSGLSRGIRRRRVLVDSDDDEVESDEGEDEQGSTVPPPFASDDDSVVSEDSDDTAIRGPPQNSSLRQRRLRQRRANNNHRVARELSAEGTAGYGSFSSRSPPAGGRRGPRVRPVVDLSQSRPMRVY